MPNPGLSICGNAGQDTFQCPAFMATCDDAVKTVGGELAGLKDMTEVSEGPAAAHTRDPDWRYPLPTVSTNAGQTG